MTADPKPRRRRAILKAAAALTMAVAVTALAMSAFRLGLAAGLAAAGGVFVVYAVPATIFDWPRLTWDDVASALGAIASAIGDVFASLFDW